MVRDVGRVLSVSYGEVDIIAKLIPNEIDMKLKKALKAEPELKKKYDDYNKVKPLID